MTDNQQSPGKLDIQWDQRAKTVTAVLDTKVLHVDSGNLTRSKFRQEFADTLVSKCPTLLRSQVVDELTRLAGEQTKPESSDMPEALNEDFIIARPERGILPGVSWLACPVSAIIDGKPGGRWMLYLRWSDGRREAVALPDFLTMGDGRRVWFNPRPNDPSANTVSGWSMPSRRSWLAGGPAADPVDLFRRICERIAHYVDFPREHSAGAAGTLALWTMFTYLVPAWESVPYLFIGGPLQSGKTRVFEILDRLTFRSLKNESLTAPTLFRILNDRGGTLLLDEAERLRSEDPEIKEILAMLLSGYRHGGKAIRMEKRGDNFAPAFFDVFGPKALACIAGLPPTLSSRCIHLTMFRAGPDSPKPRRRIDDNPREWQTLRDDLHILAMEHGDTWLKLPRMVDVCPAMSGRNFELWQPLLALSRWLDDQGAGGLFDLMTRYCMNSIDAVKDDQTPDSDETLLREFSEMIQKFQTPTPGEVLKRLQEIDHPQFAKWTARTISNRLNLYGIDRPKISHGRRAYRNVSQGQLLRIQSHYAIDLEIPIPALPSIPEGPLSPQEQPCLGSAGIEGNVPRGDGA